MSESRIKKTQKNVIMSFVQMALNFLLTFVSRIIFVRILDASYLGINGLFTNVLNVLSMADLGIATAMMYSLYKPIAESDTEMIGSLIAFFRKLYLTIAVTVLIIGLTLLPFLDHIVNLEESIPYLQWYYLLALFNVVISYLFVYRTTLLSADQKNYILSKYIMIFKVITFAVQTAVLIAFKNYFLYLLSALLVSFISNLSQNLVTLRLYPYLKEKPHKLDDQNKKKIGRDVKATFVYKVCGTIQNNTDNILISSFVGTVFVGYFSNYTMVISAITSIIYTLFGSVKASLGNLIASKDTSQEGKFLLFNVLELIDFWMIGFCSICFTCLLPDFIKIFFGPAYVLGFPPMLMAVLNFYTSNIRQTIWAFRETTGLFHETRYITAVTSLINLFLSLILGYLWGMTGILAGTVIARMVYAWWKEPIILFHKFFHQSARIYYATYIKRAILCLVAGGVTYAVCNLLLLENIYVHFVKNIVVCCIVPNVIFFVCFFRKAEFHYIWERIGRPIIQRKF